MILFIVSNDLFIYIIFKWLCHFGATESEHWIWRCTIYDCDGAHMNMPLIEKKKNKQTITLKCRNCIWFALRFHVYIVQKREAVHGCADLCSVLLVVVLFVHSDPLPCGAPSLWHDCTFWHTYYTILKNKTKRVESRTLRWSVWHRVRLKFISYMFACLRMKKGINKSWELNQFICRWLQLSLSLSNVAGASDRKTILILNFYWNRFNSHAII